MNHSHQSISTNPLIAWFADNHVLANILMLALIVGGLMRVQAMVSEVFPTVDRRTITVTTPYPGATPYEVEDAITRRVEEAVLGIDGVKRVISNATENSGTVTIELEEFADDETVLTEVETEIDRLSDFPPEDAEEPTIVRSKTSGRILTLALHGDVKEAELHEWAERIREELLQLPDISLISITGGRKKELSIEIPEQILRDYGLTLNDIAMTIRRNSQDIPSGTLRTNSAEILLRVQNKSRTKQQFENIPIINQTDGSSLRLGDIATIRDGFEDQKLINLYNGEPALFIQISRSSAQDTLRLEKLVREFLPSISLPDNMTLSVWQNETDILKDRINLLTRNAILGFTLVFFILLLFLDLKLAFWTSLGIPISFLGGLMIASLFGITINMITLFALIVVLGIVVDDAIVAGESIFDQQERGEQHMSAVLKGVRAIQSPVTIGVLTTIAAFAPLSFSTGTLGQVMKPIPIVVISILFISLFEAFFILPSHLSTSSRWSIGVLAQLRDTFAALMKGFVKRVVLPTLSICLRFRYATLAAGLAMIIITVGFVRGGLVRFVFFPQVDNDVITVTLEMPIGTPFDITKHYAERIKHAAQQLSQDLKSQYPNRPDIIKNIAITIGGTSSTDRGPGASSQSSISSHQAQMVIELISGEERPLSSRVIEKMWQELIGEIPNAESLQFQSSLVHGGADIEVELSHRHSKTLEKASNYIQNQLRNIGGVSEIQDSFLIGKREFIFELTAAGRAAGLTPVNIGNQIRQAYFGEEVQRLQRGPNEVKVMVRYPLSDRYHLDNLYQSRIRLADGRETDLRTVATIKEQRGFANIKRVDGRRVVSVTADVDDNITTPNDINRLLSKSILPNLIEQYPTLTYRFEGESREQREDIGTLQKNMRIAIMIIFVLLVAQLRSYIQPIIILMSIPFGLVGAVLGHFLLGYNLSFISLFGMVALSGVVINDSVVLIDYFNKCRDRGDHITLAATNAVERRFRPIILTTLTTSFGLLPMLLETSLQARFLIPMAISLASGILYASVIILFLIPCLLLIVDDIKLLPKQCWRLLQKS